MNVSQLVPLSMRGRRPRAWIDVQYHCRLDERSFLTVEKSTIYIYTDGDGRSGLCHFDYEREKQLYPTAHLQVHGACNPLAAMTATTPHPREPQELHKLHFPVGGRRFRPSLEDVIEFLVVEKLVDPHPRWRDVIQRERTQFQEIQLRAAIRRNPELAREVLASMPS